MPELPDGSISVESLLVEWTDRLLEVFKVRFPGAGDITAFRPGFSRMVNSGIPIINVVVRSKESATPRTEPTTAPNARLAGRYYRIDPWHVC